MSNPLNTPRLSLAEEIAISAEMASLMLSPADADAFMQAEQIVRDGLQKFLAVGTALAAISANRWYQAKGYLTFEAYCEGEWKVSRGHAYRLMQAAEIADEIRLSPIGDTVPLPSSESQLRPLTRIDAADRPAAWQEATEKAKRAGRESPTARDVEESAAPYITHSPETGAGAFFWEGPTYACYFYEKGEDGDAYAEVAIVTQITAADKHGYEIRIAGKRVGQKGIYPTLPGAKQEAQRILSERAKKQSGE